MMTTTTTTRRRYQVLLSWRALPLYAVLLLGCSPPWGRNWLRQLQYNDTKNAKAHPNNSNCKAFSSDCNDDKVKPLLLEQEENKTKNSPNDDKDKVPAAAKPSSWLENVLNSVPPRAYPYRSSQNNYASLPCFPPHPEWRSYRGRDQRTGLLFNKPTKVGGSTAAGVHLRIARNAADRENKTFSICYTSWDHGSARSTFGPAPSPELSLRWTILRHPKGRLVSTFHHFFVSRGLCTNTAENFLRYIVFDDNKNNNSQNNQYREYYLKAVAMRPTSNEMKSSSSPANRTEMVESILNDYDFVALTERMDESLVVLSMLWNVPLADVLYLSAKQGGSYDGGGRGGCHLIPPNTKSSNKDDVAQWQSVLDSPQFQSLIQWDSLVYDLANRSLDKTIDETIGRDAFNVKLAQFRQALAVAEEMCGPEVVAPCTGGGLFDDNAPTKIGSARSAQDTDCLAIDSGCGFMCLDDVATKLDLWGPHAPLQYKFPYAFSMGPSTQKRLAAKNISLPPALLSRQGL
ncbi:hypothetical protein ACA910_001063 [Epithemia clementina (nom. ined.)]